MKLSEIKKHLSTAEVVNFELQNGTSVPKHFHVTEVGVVTKHFIDCGGTIRNEKVANFQLWDANDFEHRLKPAKLLNIIKLSEEKLGMEYLEIEVENSLLRQRLGVFLFRIISCVYFFCFLIVICYALTIFIPVGIEF